MAVPCLVEAVLSFSEKRLALGVGAGGAGIEREAKLTVEVIEDGCKRIAAAVAALK